MRTEENQARIANKTNYKEKHSRSVATCQYAVAVAVK